MSVLDVARKVEWEGGVAEAIEYGIRSESIDDPALSNLWEQAETAYEQYEQFERLIDDILWAVDDPDSQG